MKGLAGGTDAAARATQLVRDLRIPVRDGSFLLADLIVPAGDGPHPAVTEFLPYRKDDLIQSLAPAHEYFAAHGYIGARIDARGTGASPGAIGDGYSERDQQDAYDACEWLAGQE